MLSYCPGLTVAAGVCLLGTVGVCVSPALSEGASFSVSSAGDDANPGTAQQPFATIVRAQRAVRELKARAGGLSSPVTVLLREGTYQLDEALTFTPEDSGTAECPVTYCAEPGGRVVVSGGQRLTGFVQSDKLWTLTLDDVKAGDWTFNQLYVNGRRRIRARTPNQGQYFRVDSAMAEPPAAFRGFFFEEGHVQRWERLDDAVFVVFGSWYSTIHHVWELDLPHRRVWFTNRAFRPFSWFEPNSRYYVENIAEGLDAPGEWYLNRETAVLSYYPLPGEEIAGAEVVAPRVRTTLIRFRGDPGSDRYVEHVHLRGLEIRHTNAHLPRNLFDARQAATVQSACVLADAARYCTIEGCEIANTGEHGIWFRNDCHHNVIRRCHVHDLGGGGVYIGEKWRYGGRDCPGWKVYPSGDAPHRTEHNTVDNCFIHDGCHQFASAPGVWIGQASYTRVSHNEICDLSYCGVSVGWDWGGRPSSAHHNTIELNHIHHVGRRRLNDLAGIYTLGLSPGTVLRNNVIHDIEAYLSPVTYGVGSAIYLDQSSGDLTIRDNVCYNVDTAGFFLHVGSRNTVVNNVFAGLRGHEHLGWGLYTMGSGDKEKIGNRLTHNIVRAPRGKLAKLAWKPGDGQEKPPLEAAFFDRNLYFAGEGVTARFAMVNHRDRPQDHTDLAGWQQFGLDLNGLVADPLFVDPDAHDYRLRPDSPAHALGIKQIDISRVGLYGDRAWVDLARTVTLTPPDPPAPWTRRTPLLLREDYENCPVGYVPDHVVGVDRKAGGIVGVTDEQAAGGGRCLKFTDAPGLERPYWPIRRWTRLLVSDAPVAVRFDCMNSAETPATFTVEFRDWTDTLQTGVRLGFKPDGYLELGPERRLTCEPGKWYHVDIQFELGPHAVGAYTLRFAPKDEPAETLTIPFLSEHFRILTWFGFISGDNARRSAFYIDNLHVDTE